MLQSCQLVWAQTLVRTGHGTCAGYKAPRLWPQGGGA